MISLCSSVLAFSACEVLPSSTVGDTIQICAVRVIVIFVTVII